MAEEHPGLADEAVAELCERDGMALLTFDKDFGKLVFRRGLRSGSAIVLFRFIPDSPEAAAAILGSLIETAALVPGVFCVVTRERVRTRQFPPRAVS